MCTYQHNTHTDTHRHAILTRCTDEQANEATNKQINIMAETETADHTVALLLFFPSLCEESGGRERDLKRGGAENREWVSARTQQQATTKKGGGRGDENPQNIRTGSTEWEEGRKQVRGGGGESGEEKERWV